MSSSKVDTSVNPGSNNQVRVLPLTKLIRRSGKLIFKAQFRESFNLFLAGASNIINRSFGKRNKEVFQCSVCNAKVPFFYAHGNRFHIIYNSICPNCSSRSRHRGLVFLYKEILEENANPVSVLHFAPEPIFYPIFKSDSRITYHTTDFFLKDVDFTEDIQKLSFPDGQYDLVLCNHVIEHVPDDEAALFELNRILKPGGRAVITIPGDFARNETIYFSDLKFNGHYRDYGLDVLDKMRKHFKHVEFVDMHKFDQQSDIRHGIRPFDLAFLCTK